MVATHKKGAALVDPTAGTCGVLDFLQTALPRKALQHLYEEESRGQFVCRAVLQQLPEPAQQIVLRMQCTGGSFSLQGIRVWTTATTKQLEHMLKEMQRWGIVAKLDSGGGSSKDQDDSGVVVSLTPSFAAGLRASLCSLDASPWQPLAPVQLAALEQEAGLRSGTAGAVTPEDLERHTQEQWDAVLHKLVGTAAPKKQPPPSVIAFLSQTGLMRPDPDYKGGKGDPDDAPLVITEKGYDFMLQDNHEQVWHFVLQYVRSLEKHELGEILRKEALLFLISLSFARVGGAYLASSLNKNCRTMMKDLSHFGLIYTRKIGKATLFYPTRVAHQLVGTPSSSNSTAAAMTVWSTTNKTLEVALADPYPENSSHLAIIVQTNFQLCAYTTSELHLSMLSLFCDDTKIRRLPNVCFMYITRDSVQSAFHRGIRARQILRFLEKHTHPKLREMALQQQTTGATSTPVPANVVDQIWLWDREMARVKFQRVYQHQLRMGLPEFHAVHQYALEKGCLAWSSERRQQLFLDYRYLERIQAFVRQWRAQAVSRPA